MKCLELGADLWELGPADKKILKEANYAGKIVGNF
jgi:hypothetical protein